MCLPSISSGAFSRRFLPAVLPAMDGSRLVRFLVAFFLTDAPSCTSGLWLRATSRKDGPGSDSSPQAVPTRGQGRPATGDHDGEGRGTTAKSLQRHCLGLVSDSSNVVTRPGNGFAGTHVATIGRLHHGRGRPAFFVSTTSQAEHASTPMNKIGKINRLARAAGSGLAGGSVPVDPC